MIYHLKNLGSQQWVINTRRADLDSYTCEHLYKNYIVCENHFEESQFMNPNVKKKKLIHTAVPTLFDVPNPPPKVTLKRSLPHRENVVRYKSGYNGKILEAHCG